jgi:histidyl-tRNA synthetase
MEYYDEIVSIKKIDKRKTIDISIDGNNLFYANNILTHNSGFGNVELDLTNTGDSLGFVQYADLVIGVTKPEEFKELNKLLWMILKNRFGLNEIKFPVNVIYEKMRVFDDKEAHAKPIFDNAPKTEKEKEDNINKTAENVSNIIKKNKIEENKKFIDWE